MSLDNIDLFSTGGFLFFLLIILVGYIFVEIFFGKKYFFRELIENYNNNLFDRILHYIFWGFFLNLFILILFDLTGNLEGFATLLNDAGEISNLLIPIVGEENVIDSQLIIFSIGYFLMIFIIGLFFKIIIFLISHIFNFLGNKIPEIKKIFFKIKKYFKDIKIFK